MRMSVCALLGGGGHSVNGHIICYNVGRTIISQGQRLSNQAMIAPTRNSSNKEQRFHPSTIDDIIIVAVRL